MTGAAVARKPLDGLALFLGLIVATVVAARPALGAYILALVVPVTSGFQKGFPIPNVNLSEALIAVVGMILLVVAPRRAEFGWHAFDWMLFAFCGGWLVLGLLDGLNLHTGLSYSAIDPLIGPFQFLILYRAIAVSLSRKAERRAAIACLLLASLPVDLLAYLQQTGYPVVNRVIAHMTGGGVFETYAYSYFARATGPFPHWTPLAGYLLVILLIGFACLLFGVALPISRRVVAIILLLAAVSLILTAEISAIAGAIGGAILLGVWAGRQRQMVRWLITGVIVAAVFGGSYFAKRLDTEFVTSAGSGRNHLVPQTVSFRWQIWTGQYFPVIVERPLTGWGEALPATITWQFTESQYVTMLMAGGIPLLVVFGGEMMALYDQSRRQARRTDLEDSATPTALGNAVAALVVVLVPMDVIYPYITSSGLPEPLFVAAGIAAACVYWGRRRPASGTESKAEADPPVHAAPAAPKL
jgi:ABC-type multidrug transport system fused ATPase/permease subunit